MNNVITFVITNRADKSFIDDFFEMHNFENSCNAILSLGVQNFIKILNSYPDDYKFRMVIHEGLTSRGGYSRRDAIISELESYFPGFKKQKLVFISREPQLFPKQERYVDDQLGRHLNFSHSNQASTADLLQVYTKSAFMGKPAVNKAAGITTKKLEAEIRKIDFAVLTALHEHEYTAFKTKCKTKVAAGIYNGYHATFKELIKLPNGSDYQNDFLLVHQQQMGLVDAAIHTTQIIGKAMPTFLLMGGVCGGRAGVVNQYDIIIPSTVHDYATGKFMNGRLESLQYKATIDGRLQKFIDDNKSKIIANMRQLIDEDRSNLLSDNFKIVIGDFACGPWVVKTEGMMNKMADEQANRLATAKANREFIDKLPVEKINKNIKGLEMESYSILRAGNIVQKNGQFSLVAKCVMDFTNEQKNDGQFKEIKSSAAYISYLCIRAMMPLLLDFKKKVKKWT